MKRLLSVVMLLITLVAMMGSPITTKALEPEVFEIILLPDTQKYSRAYPHIFTAQTTYIRDQEIRRNIKFVSHMGDIVDRYENEVEWQRASESLSIIDGKVPYGLVVGNHDLGPILPRYYYQYFPVSRYEGQFWYGGNYYNNNRNSYQIRNIGTGRYLFMHIEYCTVNNVIDWVNDVIASYPDRDVMISTHYFLDEAGERGEDLSCEALGRNTADDIWEKVVVPNSRVKFVFSGHINTGDGDAWRVDQIGDRKVLQIMTDYQHIGQGGDGYFKMLKLDQAQNLLTVKTYSPYLGEYMRGGDHEFSYSMNNVPGE